MCKPGYVQELCTSCRSICCGGKADPGWRDHVGKRRPDQPAPEDDPLMTYQHDIGAQQALPHFDQSLIWSAILLLSLGLVMVYSASISIAEAGQGTNNYPAFF